MIDKLKPCILVDFRREDFSTMLQLDGLVLDMLEDFAEMQPGCTVTEVVISEWQMKQLRFDRYLHGTPKESLQDAVLLVHGVVVTASKFDEGCPNCGSAVHWD